MTNLVYAHNLTLLPDSMKIFSTDLTFVTTFARKIVFNCSLLGMHPTVKSKDV